MCTRSPSPCNTNRCNAKIAGGRDSETDARTDSAGSTFSSATRASLSTTQFLRFVRRIGISISPLTSKVSSSARRQCSVTCASGSPDISSTSRQSPAKLGTPTAGAYCAAKFGVVGFTETTNNEGRPHGVKASVVCPGPVDTKMRRDNHPGRCH